MLNIERLIYSHYNQNELELFKDRLKNKFIWNPFGNIYSANNPALMPLQLINEDKTLKVAQAYCTTIRSTDAEDTSTMARICEYSKTSNPEDNCMTVLTCKRGWTFAQTWAENNNYTRLDKIELYLMQDIHHRIRVFKKEKHTLIITNYNSDELEATLFSAIPLIYQTEFLWNETLINYFRNIKNNETSIETFKSIIKNAKILENIKYQQLLKIVENTNSHVIKTHLKNEAKILDDIEHLETTLKNAYQDLQKTQALIAFFNPNTNTKDIADYIYNNPYIVDYYSTSTSKLIIAIEAPLEYIDVPAFKQMLKNMNSYLYPTWRTENLDYTDLTKGHPIEFVEMIKDLFLSNKYKVYTRSEIVLDFENKDARPLRRCSSDYSRRPNNWKLESRLTASPERCIIPHMHIEYYDCWSGNKSNITKCLLKQDIIGALDICINTTKDINVNDSAVFGRFIKHVLVKPSEFSTGYASQRDCYFSGIPGGEYNTIWDTTQKKFRTFLDIFTNDYLKGNTKQVELSEELTNLFE